MNIRRISLILTLTLAALLARRPPALCSVTLKR
jgi:hypothetical protein